jgi:hypothetical protein
MLTKSSYEIKVVPEKPHPLAKTRPAPKLAVFMFLLVIISQILVLSAVRPQQRPGAQQSHQVDRDKPKQWACQNKFSMKEP